MSWPNLGPAGMSAMWYLSDDQRTLSKLPQQARSMSSRPRANHTPM